MSNSCLSCIGCISLPICIIFIGLAFEHNIFIGFLSIIVCLLALYFLIKHQRGLLKPTFTCPHCYSSHQIGECGFKCGSLQENRYNSVCAFSVEGDTFLWVYQKHKHDCYLCKYGKLQIFCPVHPDKEIPKEYLQLQSFPIAILGAKASGKSIYIGVLVQEISGKMALPFSCSLRFDNKIACAETYDQNYYQPLYRDGQTVMATQAGVEIHALIFPLDFWNIHKKSTLTIFDTAGDNLNNVDSMLLLNGYISFVHGIILLIDPLQILVIRDQLVAKGFTDLPEQNTDTATILDTVIQTIRRGRTQSDQISTPLALVLTKIDVLEEYDILPADSCLRTESEHLQYGRFVNPDFERTHSEIETLINTWMQGALMSYVRQFKHYAFFGVSALGANPSGTTLGGKVNPRRVLDPLLWLLAKENYIESLD